MKKMLLHSLVVCLLLGGCTVTGRLQRRGLGARANYAPKEQKQEPKKESAPQYVEYKHRDSLKPIYFLPTRWSWWPNRAPSPSVWARSASTS